MSNSSSSNSKSAAAQPRGWRVVVAWALILVFVVEIATALFVKPADKGFAVSAFARLPLVFNGRVQPMDSLARNSLMQIRGITEVPLEGNGVDGAWGSWEELRAKGGELAERKWFQFSKHPKKLKQRSSLCRDLANSTQPSSVSTQKQTKLFAIA